MRSHPWELLRRISSTIVGGWVVFGDFIEILFSDEKTIEDYVEEKLDRGLVNSIL